MAHVVVSGSFESWHAHARDLLIRDIPPESVVWTDARNAQLSLPAAPPVIGASATPERRVTVPASFLEDASLAARHRSGSQWTLLYGLLWRITHGERRVHRDPLDADARALATMVGAVRRDEHKMHAFVRFRRIQEGDGERFVAFHRPDHYIVDLVAPFFVERFHAMRWSILTPDECVHWDGTTVEFTSGVNASVPSGDDELEALWRTYYASVFNPARLNVRAMSRELPRRHWATLPEASVIPSLVAGASRRVERMLSEPSRATSARPFIPAKASLNQLRDAAPGCRGCDLFATASHVVFGEGPTNAPMMLVGEQPGDEEDLRGMPFIGPAGNVLADAITAAGLDRSALYVTNAVKHFTFRREGKRRIHERPRISDVRACRPWLEAEIDTVRPDVIVCLGSTAAQTLIGPQVRIQRDRGTTFSSAWAPHVLITYHPSAVLRAQDRQHRDELFQWLVEDLKSAARFSDRAAAPTSEGDAPRAH